MRGPAGYTLGARVTTTVTTPPTAAVMRLRGDLDGEATWELTPGADGTDVELVMDVVATRPWMIRLAPVARPLFEWSHGTVVRHAVEAATASLEARLVRFESAAEKPPT